MKLYVTSGLVILDNSSMVTSLRTDFCFVCVSRNLCCYTHVKYTKCEIGATLHRFPILYISPSVLEYTFTSAGSIILAFSDVRVAFPYFDICH